MTCVNYVSVTSSFHFDTFMLTLCIENLAFRQIMFNLLSENMTLPFQCRYFHYTAWMINIVFHVILARKCFYIPKSKEFFIVSAVDWNKYWLNTFSVWAFKITGYEVVYCFLHSMYSTSYPESYLRSPPRSLHELFYNLYSVAVSSVSSTLQEYIKSN